MNVIYQTLLFTNIPALLQGSNLFHSFFFFVALDGVGGGDEEDEEDEEEDGEEDGEDGEDGEEVEVEEL